MTSRIDILTLLEEQERRKKYNAIKYFEPYEWQKDFMNASANSRQKLAMCANQVGKSVTGAAETTYHLTGLYPEWWEGKRFDGPIKAWACGISNDSTKRIVQSELLGECTDPDALGTGMIPLDCIGVTTRKAGVPNALESVLVKHHNAKGEFDGWSLCGFMSYEMGQAKFMGARMHWIWLDEEPPEDIYTQCVTRTTNTGGVVSKTFTPEQGLTKVVRDFLNNLKPGQHLTRATWEDVMEIRDDEGNVVRKGHLTPEKVEQLLSVYSPHERDMRSKGEPVFGSGAVFPVHMMEDIKIEPFSIPQDWPRICGLDFGWDHPTAAVWIAWDRATNILYLYDCYKQSKVTAVVHADVLKSRGNIITVWPKDGNQSDKGSGVNLAEQYRQAGVNMTPEYFRNKDTVADSKFGQFAIEPGIQELYARMENGTFRVFSHLSSWFLEFSSYYRQDGKIVAMEDDLMSATRYAACSVERWAAVPHNRNYNWEGPLDYPPLGPGFRN